jgi:hypothetical protein
MEIPRPLRIELSDIVRRSIVEARPVADTEADLRKRLDKWLTKKAKERAPWLGLLGKLDPHKKKIDTKARKIMREMKAAVLRKVRKGPAFKKDLLVEEKAVGDIVAVLDASRRRWQTMSSEIGDAVGDAGDRTMELLDVDIAFDNLDPAVLDWIEVKGLDLAKSVTGTVKEEVRAILTQGMEDGLTTGQVANQISVYFDGSEAWKAERIARTEINAAQAFASSEAYKQSGVVSAKEWVASPDACDDCADEDGSEFELDADDIPLHPS